MPTYTNQGHHGEFEPDKAQYSTPFFFWLVFLIGAFETQNLGKARALEALVAVAALLTICIQINEVNVFFCSFQVNQRNVGRYRVIEE